MKIFKYRLSNDMSEWENLLFLNYVTLIFIDLMNYMFYIIRLINLEHDKSEHNKLRCKTILLSE